MTEKDLLYMEDAIGHEKNLINIFNYYLEILEDNNLKSFLKKEITKHTILKQKLLNTMEDLSNE